MTYAELTRKLERLGMTFRRQAGGSHEIWRNPEKNLYTLIPRHTGREMRKGTVAKIVKDLGLKMDDLVGV